MFGKKNIDEEIIEDDVWHVPDEEEWEKIHEHYFSDEPEEEGTDTEEGSKTEAFEQEEKLSFFQKLLRGLRKTRDNFLKNMDYVFRGFTDIDDDFYEELEEVLIMGDLGVRTTDRVWTTQVI